MKTKEVLSKKYPNQKWKDVKGAEGRYFVSDQGNVYSAKSKRLVGKPWGKGYAPFGYFDNNKKKVATNIHSIVAKNFVKGRTKQRCLVNHINGNPRDNRASNLEWSTPAENIRHAWDTGLSTRKQGQDSHGAKLTEEQVFLMKVAYHSGFRYFEIAKNFGVNRSHVAKIMQGYFWSHKMKVDNVASLSFEKIKLCAKSKTVQLVDQDGAKYLFYGFHISGLVITDSLDRKAVVLRSEEEIENWKIEKYEE